MNRIPLTEDRVKELRNAAKEVNMKVTEFVADGVRYVRMKKNYQFDDFVRAAKFIQRVAATEYPDNGVFIG